MVSAEISWPTVELLDSTNAVAAFTVTTSLTLPIFSARLTVETWSTETVIFFSTSVSNPFCAGR